jgi:hypothetical protein
MSTQSTGVKANGRFEFFQNQQKRPTATEIGAAFEMLEKAFLAMGSRANASIICGDYTVQLSIVPLAPKEKKGRGGS